MRTSTIRAKVAKMGNKERNQEQSKRSESEWMDTLREDNPELSDEELEEISEET
jgi:hypothetical protein